MGHLSSDGHTMPGRPRKACGCQSCRHRFGPPPSEEQAESFPEYLRRVGADHRASGHEYTAEDYDNAAARIEELEAALTFIVNDVPAPGEDAQLTVKGYNLACAVLNKGRE